MSCFNCKRDSSYVAPARTNQNMSGTGSRNSQLSLQRTKNLNTLDYIGRESGEYDRPPSERGKKINKRFQTGASVMDRLGDIASGATSFASTAFLDIDTSCIEGDWKEVVGSVAAAGGKRKDEIEDTIALESLLAHGYVMESYSPLMGSSVFLTRDGADLLCHGTEQDTLEAALESIKEDLTGIPPKREKENKDEN